MRVESSFAGLEALREDWDAAVAALEGTIYMTYDWAKTWWEFYGKGRDLRLFFFQVDGDIVGIVPIYIDALGFGPFRFRIARLVGSNIPPKIFDPPIDQRCAPDILRQVVSHLFGGDKCDVLSLGPVSERHCSSQALVDLGKTKTTPMGAVTLGSEDVHSVFLLPGSFEEYLDSLSKNERKKYRQELNQIKKEGSVQSQVISGPNQAEHEFQQFFDLHTAQWEGNGKLGHFLSWPKGREFNEALVRSQGRLGRVRFIRLLAGDQVVANIYGFAFGGRLFAELPARAVGERWQRVSLGRAGLFVMIEAAIKESLNSIEGGLAHYDYKLRLNATEYRAKTIRAVRRSFASRIRLRAYLCLRFAVLWGYHKLWYNRISPRLSARFRKPIWAFWLRLDF